MKDLIHGDVEDKMGIAQALFDEGLLATVSLCRVCVLSICCVVMIL